MDTQSPCDVGTLGKSGAGGSNAQNWMRVRISVKDMLRVSKRFSELTEEDFLRDFGLLE